ncbi:MAG: NAD(P)/FAD-dependent oxidoreductase [Alphaproteobacteria bacterium]|nr:NAD(P)/FAD-dependent oxidoreductase [Alphaproteobacteria bacterium]MDE2013985.1 NAD(P)/FAD-dependent oxidoreductase [Alphaproteobacteria bacterium]
MSELLQSDVLVVGLGPAGASAAEAAARAGARVIGLDRKEQAGVPVQCAEFLPAMLSDDAANCSLRQAIAAMQTSVENAAPDLTADFRGRMIDRARFDAELVARAFAAGADCRFGASLANLSADGVATLSDGTRVEARVIVGADGPRSRVGAAIGAINRELVETRQITVALRAPHDATDIFLSAEIVGGYGWLFPKGDVANLGLGVAPEFRARLKPLLDGLRARLIAEGRIGEAILGHTGGAIPVGGMNAAQGTLGDCAVLLAGDAAGLVNPVTGAGIPAAVISGRLAGAAVAQILSGKAHSYSEDLEDLFSASLARALARRRELLAKFECGKPDERDLRRGWIAYPEYWAA